MRWNRSRRGIQKYHEKKRSAKWKRGEKKKMR